MSTDQEDPYVFRAELPRIETYLSLREIAGMPPRSREGAERGLPNTLLSITATDERNETVVGYGRVVGDDGTLYQISEVVVHPDHQRRGIGSGIMKRLMERIESRAPPGAFVCLLSDVDGFYERFGFAESRPDSKGMYRRL